MLFCHVHGCKDKGELAIPDAIYNEQVGMKDLALLEENEYALEKVMKTLRDASLAHRSLQARDVYH